MRWRAAFLALPLMCCATWTKTGRVVNDPCVHVGVRPASDGLGDFAVTVQVTTDWPRRCVVPKDAGPPTGVSGDP